MAGTENEGHRAKVSPQPPAPAPEPEPEPLRGRGLRFVLVAELQRHGTMTVAEMVRLIDAKGFSLGGRASKVISDSLRWELLRGRVKRLGRGVYSYGRVPKTTLRRIALFARQCGAWIEAVIQGETPPPTPATPEHRKTCWKSVIEDPLRPPWVSLTWCWDM